ncbi:O-antigen/teichoic acid export membrane protein [Sphaerotilus hippei]|uniref:O-antigen/teichoic acid export membrane protein n=1 Tax=Sphaerotilus hippei TaxID=744406 RepID=A0A318H0T5_9BURK|nr:oligosaccharide flippase family protein [Sphaerotilus hippei]PXW96198.1 O-antigen/teichoic acid export membrane protein [Sphaerotilus hippei]
MKLLHALSSSFGARLLMAALNYGLFWLLSHRLGASELGGYSLLMNLFFMLQMLPLLGLSTPLTRHVATARTPLAGELSTALALALPVAALIALALGLTGRLAYPPALHGPFWLLAASLLPSAWTLVAEVGLIGLERMSLIARVQCAEALGRTLGSALVVHSGGGLDALFLVFLVGRCLTALVYLRQPALPRPRWQALDAAIARRFRREVPVFLGIAVLAGVAGRLDLVLLSRLGGLAEAGIYAASARLYEAALMLPTIAAMVMLPTLSRLYRQDRGEFIQVLARSLQIALAGGLVVALGVAALAGPLIDLLYAPGLQAAAGPLRWLIFAAVLMTLDQTLSSTMVAAEAQREDLRTMGLALLALTAGLLLLVPALGPLGAAISVPLALAVRVAWRLRWLLRHHPCPELLPRLLRTLLAGALATGALVLTLPHHPALTLAAALATYALALLGSGVVRGRHLARLVAWRRPARPSTSR